MPRQKRLNVPGAVYHIIVRGLDRQPLFRDDADRREFLTRFSDSLRKTRSLCYAWALMPNHIHLMVRCSEFPLNDLMRSPLTGYAVYFNRRHGRVGYLYQNRYKSILCQEGPYFLELVRYIHLNPLRAGVVGTFDDLDRYPWTGHRALLGRATIGWQATGEVLSQFSERPRTASKKYVAFLRDGLRGPIPDFTGGGLRRSAGGWTRVLELKRAGEYWRGDARILGDGNFVNQVLKASDEALADREHLLRSGWDLDKIIDRACEAMKVSRKDFAQRGRANALAHAKSLAAFWATRVLGLSGEAVGRALHMTRQAVSFNSRRGRDIAEQDHINLTI